MVQQRSFPFSVSPAPSEDPASMSRRVDDSFSPPLGQPTYYLTSVGYGKEVGLPEGMHEVYDPCSQKSLILDHNTSKIVICDPHTHSDQKVVVQGAGF